MVIKEGDLVKTHYGEEGIVAKPFSREEKTYDWWVEVKFKFRGRERTTLEPYRERELEKISKE